MDRYTPDEILDLVIDEYMLADEEVVCNAKAITYFNACWPSMWVAETAYITGDIVRPPTGNSFVYECTAGGTSGATEPPWSTIQDETFTDGTATFKAHENYALVNAELTEDDKIKGDGETDGRMLTIGQVMGAMIHTSGTVSHTALIDNAHKKLKFVTPASTSLEENNDVVSGRTTLLHELKIVIRDPAAPAA
jgi:hypothetical protein